MNFEYSQDQLTFRESVIKFLQQEYSFEARQKILKSDAAYSERIWESCADLGWLSLPFDEELGGFGGTAVDSILLFEELGKHLVTEPFMETMLQVGGILQACRHPQRLDYIEKLMAGELQGALAHSEPYQAHFEQGLRTRATELDGGYQLRGIKSLVYNATAADIFIISAELEGDKALFLVPADQEGLSVKGYDTVDGRQAGELELDAMWVAQEDLLAAGSDAVAILNSILDKTLLAQVAEMVGAMQILLDTTVDYASERKQFGVTLSFFQVLQHKMVEMFMATELVRSLMYAAAIKLRDGTDDARAYVAAAKVKADKGARLVAQFAVQLHGGIGTTDELKIGHYLKHIEVLIHQFGATQSHISRYQSLR